MTPKLKKKLTRLSWLEIAIVIIGLIFYWATQVNIELHRLIIVIAVILMIVSIFIVLLPIENYWQNLSIIVGFALTIIGWFVNSFFNSQDAQKQNQFANENAVKNAQLELTTKYLLNSYLLLQNAANRDSDIFANQFMYLKSVEFAFGTASLLGDSELIKKSNRTATDIPGSVNYIKDYTALLYQFRTDLRNKLGLDSLKNGTNNEDSSYDIYFYRRYLRDSTRKTNPKFYDDLERETAKQFLNRQF